MSGQTAKIWILSIAAALAAGYGTWLFYDSFIGPSGCCRATWPLPNPLQAERLIAAKDPQALNAALQRTAALTMLQARPGDVDAWLRLAFADRLAHGRLTAEGFKALDASYSITPFAGPRALWRTAFVLDNWTGLPQRVRTDAINEIAIIKGDSGLKYRLRLRTAQVSDPNGRLAAALYGVLPLPGGR